MNFGNLTKCPVKGCLGFYTTTSKPNIVKHIRNIAATETLSNYLLGTKQMNHAKYIKENMIVEKFNISKIKTNGKIVSLNFGVVKK